MIKVVKLSNGEEMIGDVSPVNEDAYAYKIENPMYIDHVQGGMKLRDALHVSTDQAFNFRSSDILHMYEPLNLLTVYYIKNLEYCVMVSRPYAEVQLKEVIAEIEGILQRHSNNEAPAVDTRSLH